jgi:hypothetical protein
VRFFGAARRSRARKNAQSSAKNQVLGLRMLCCVVPEEFGAQAFLLTLAGTDFGGGGLVQAVLERP